MEMRGILDIDFLCLKEIFKLLTPLDLCSLRQSCTQLREFVDDYCRSIYFAREKSLDLRGENIRNVNRILTNFGKFVLHLKVGEKTMKPSVLLDVIASNGPDILKGLSFHNLSFYETDMERCAELFNKIEILEIIRCDGNQKCFEDILLGHELANLTKLTIRYSAVGRENVRKFFMRPRNIKKLSCHYIDIFPLIVLNAGEIEELDIVAEVDSDLMSLAQLRNLKRLEIDCDQRSIIALINELSLNNQLEMLGIQYLTFNDEFCNALFNLTNLNKLRFKGVEFTVNDIKSIEMLGQKMSKLESLMLVDCFHFPYRKFLASACKSDKFRKIYISYSDINSFIEQMVNDCSNGKGTTCFVSGNPLYIYLEKATVNYIEHLLTQNNIESIQKYGNIKILRADDDVFID